MRKIIITLIHLFIGTLLWSQGTVTGTFTGLINQQINLIGYSGLDTYVIDSTKVNKKGEFSLVFDKKDYGIAYIQSKNNKSYVVILAENENLQLKGTNFELQENIKIIQGKQNQLFVQYAKEHIRREQTLNALYYLGQTYKLDTLFFNNHHVRKVIEAEKKRIKADDSLFLTNLPVDSYVSYYLPLRKLVSSVSNIAQYRTKDIPVTFNEFHNLDYTDQKLYKSGLLKDAIENHFWLIENSGQPLDSVFIEMKFSIDNITENLIKDEQKLNEIGEHLFKFLEQRSLFKASEYLAIKLLNEKTCTLNNDFALQLESYRAMKKGNIAADIYFADDISDFAYMTDNKAKKLSEIKSTYKVVVFGASWCAQCAIELQEISKNYSIWKQQEVEVIFVSLDTDKRTFESFIKPFQFISICDYKKWQSKAVKDYYVSATPTIYLLNNKHEILLKPNSVTQLNSWIDWFLIKGNK